MTNDAKTVAEAPPGRGVSPPLGTLGEYVLEKMVGRGGMGAVYLARQANLDRKVVIKVIAPECAGDAITVQRFLREAKAAAKVSSENVVQVFSTGQDGTTPYIVMEFVDGSSLAGLLEREYRLPWDRATRLLLQAARGLKAAHEQGVLHRDVKPANILISKTGQVKVADFGLAKVERREDVGGIRSATLSVEGQILGTPAYMAPEQAEGQQLDARADVYALGATYYEMLTGRRPFEGETVLKTLAMVISQPVVPPRAHARDVPEPVENLVLRLMDRDKTRRPRDAGEVVRLLEELDQALMPGKQLANSGYSGALDPPAPSSAPPRPSGRTAPRVALAVDPPSVDDSKLRLYVGAACVAFLALSSAVFFLRPSEADRPLPPKPAVTSVDEAPYEHDEAWQREQAEYERRRAEERERVDADARLGRQEKEARARALAEERERQRRAAEEARRRRTAPPPRPPAPPTRR